MIFRKALRVTQRLLPQRADHLSILVYHLVGAGTDSPVDLEVEQFESQLDEIVETADVVGLSAGVERMAQDPSVGSDGRPLVSLTFDDAYENFYEVVWPRLAERALPATLCVPVGFVEGETRAPIRGTNHLHPATWSMIREMVDSGIVTIGSHSWSHRDMRTLSLEELRHELIDSRRHLEDQIGRSTPTFCYPRGLWNRRVERSVAEAYDSALVGGGRAVRPENLQPLRIWRTSLRADAPKSMKPLVSAPVWLEEAVTDALRRLRHSPR